jgi:metal-dependent amidase/aminoacylase/carboxypeptidase family protein
MYVTTQNTHVSALICKINKYSCSLFWLTIRIINPELGFQEYHAHDVLTRFLNEAGFDVDRKYKLDTAFRAVYGDGKPHIAVLCEYDALPNIGHACGHNLIAEVGVATGMAIKAAMASNKQKVGKVRKP